MTRSHRFSGVVVVPVVAAAALLSSCVASRQQPFAMSFLPASPAPAPVSFDEPPRITPSFYKHELPALITPLTAANGQSSEAEKRIRRADERLEAGKRLYQEGKTEEARTEFNKAVDTLLTASDTLPDRQRLERRLETLVDEIFRYDLEGLGSGVSQDAVVYDKSPLDGILEMTFPIDPNLKPKVKEEVLATTSQLPLEANDSVLSYIHYFSTDRGRKTLLTGLRRAGRYKPLIQRILDEEGVPQELIYLAQAESGFLPHAVSEKQASGMWQFVQWRGREYGLEQTASADDRLDPEKSTRAAARHLRDLYHKLGDWYLAMAAYNCGPGCVDRAVQRTGFADFWELRNRGALPRQTMNYVPLILAITIMAKNPADYGLTDVELDRPLEYDTLQMHAATSVALVADAADRPVSEVRELNPSLLRPIAPAGYLLRVPKGSASAIVASLENVPESHRASWRMHRVDRGETLAQIAQAFKTPATSIAEANNRIIEAPAAGDLLIIPASYEAEHVASGSRHAKSSRHAVASRRGRSGRLTASSRRVPDQVLHHRAAARTLKSASVNGRKSHHRS